MTQANKYSSWISVVGMPNAGKSTLFNSMMENKLAIVSPKAQTTRNSLKGIKTIGSKQLVFIDTPGLLNPEKRIDKFMLKSIQTALSDSDQILFIHDATRSLQEKELDFLHKSLPKDSEVILVLNKIDRIEKNRLLELTQKFQEAFNFRHILMVSALKKSGIDDLLRLLTDECKNIGWFFEENQITTAPISFLAEEIVREKVLFNTHQEIPYNIFLQTDLIEDKEDIYKIHMTLFTTSLSNKKILIGKQGDMFKKISTQSRLELEKLLNKKVFLRVHIKVQDWEKKLNDKIFVNY